MTPALLYCSEDTLPFSRLEKVRGDVLWCRDGHYRWLPAGRIREYKEMPSNGKRFNGPDSPPVLEGIPWIMTEELKPDE